MAFRRWAYSLTSIPAGSAEAASVLGSIEDGGLACETILGVGIGGRGNEGECKSGDGQSHKERRKARK
ncbi:hypothetical protein FRC09_018457, partial [Ceratobasidium sp. 395]